MDIGAADLFSVFEKPKSNGPKHKKFETDSEDENESAEPKRTVKKKKAAALEKEFRNGILEAESCSSSPQDVLTIPKTLDGEASSTANPIDNSNVNVTENRIDSDFQMQSVPGISQIPQFVEVLNEICPGNINFEIKLDAFLRNYKNLKAQNASLISEIASLEAKLKAAEKAPRVKPLESNSFVIDTTGSSKLNASDDNDGMGSISLSSEHIEQRPTDFKAPIYEQRQPQALGANIDDENAAKPTSRLSCFNCEGEHSLRDCSKPHDKEAISRNRRKYQMNQPNQDNRYHDPFSQKIKPGGEITDGLRQALGLQSKQVPPYIYMMRKLGYPPGWLKAAEIIPSGLSVYGHENEDASNATKDAYAVYDMNKIVEYPGFNVPLPKGWHDEADRYNAPAMEYQQSKDAFCESMKAKKQIASTPNKHKTAKKSEEPNEPPRKKARTEEAETSNENLSNVVEIDKLNELSKEDLLAERARLQAELEDGELEEEERSAPSSPPLLDQDEIVKEPVPISLDSNTESDASADLSTQDQSSTTKLIRSVSSRSLSVEMGTPTSNRHAGRVPELGNFAEGIQKFELKEEAPVNNRGAFQRLKQLLFKKKKE